jgi:hypothetical protein
MNPALKIAGAAVLVVAALAGSIYLFGANGGGIGAPPKLSPSEAPSDSIAPTPSPTPAPTPFDPMNPEAYRDWSTYTSEIYGAVIGHPADWTVIPAARAWEVETDAANHVSEAAEAFLSPSEDIRVSVWTVPVQEGTTLREWVEAYCELNTTPCEGLDERLEPALREVWDQHLAGALIEFEDDVQAFMPSWAYDTDMATIWTDPAPADGGEITVVAGWRPAYASSHSRELVEGFSLQLCPDCEAP